MAKFEKLLKTVFYPPDVHSIAMATEGKERLRLDANGRFRFGAKGKPENETVRITGETNDASKFSLKVTNASGTTLFAVRNDGWINYDRLAKLDVSDNFTATIRAADLLLGHSSRRGTIGRGPGRALVDLTRELHLNYAADWPDGIRYLRRPAFSLHAGVEGKRRRIVQRGSSRHFGEFEPGQIQPQGR